MREGALLPYQQRWFNDQSIISIWEKSRRVGATYAEASRAVIEASRDKSRGGCDVLYIPTRKEMALEFIASVAFYARAFNQGLEMLGNSLFEDGGDDDILAYTVRFPNSGFKVTALSSAPSNLRGMQGNVIIDEAGHQKSLNDLLKAAVPLTMWGGKIRIIGTHNGVTSEFNQLIGEIRAGRKNYNLHRTTLDDALKEGLYRRICFVTKKKWSLESEQEWRQSLIESAVNQEAADEEYFCVPNKSGGNAISRVVIESAMSADYPVLTLEKDNDFNQWAEHLRFAEVKDWCEQNLLPELKKLNDKCRFAFGEDFGRVCDLTVIAPMRIEANLHRTVPFLVELRNIPFKQQEQVLFYVVDRLPRLIGGALDAGGNGAYLAETARHKYGSRIQEIKLSNQWYLENMPKLKAAFDDQTITIPASDDVASDLNALQIIDGIIKLPSTKNKSTTGLKRHGDSAIALAMAYFATLQSGGEIDYIDVKTSRFDAIDNAFGDFNFLG